MGKGNNDRVWAHLKIHRGGRVIMTTVLIKEVPSVGVFELPNGCYGVDRANPARYLPKKPDGTCFAFATSTVEFPPTCYEHISAPLVHVRRPTVEEIAEYLD